MKNSHVSRIAHNTIASIILVVSMLFPALIAANEKSGARQAQRTQFSSARSSRRILSTAQDPETLQSTSQSRSILDESTLANNIDEVEFFVRQHYRDFLNREADPSGLAFWVNNINSCGSDQQCILVKRVDTSAAFFLSIEFQQTGFLVYRAHKAAFGNLQGKPVPLKLVELLPDTRTIGQGVVVGATGWEQALENNKVAYFNDFVSRSRFTIAYPTTLTPAQFVNALDQNAGGVLAPTERDSLVNGLTSGAKSRAQVVRAVAEDSDLSSREFNKAFVLMQYCGYLRRNADDAPDNNMDGFNFWLAKLNQFNGDFRAAEMVKAFIVAGEYRSRFISGEEVISSVNGSLSSGFGKLQLPGVMEIEVTDNSARPPMTFTLSRVSAPALMSAFRSDVAAEGLPPVSTSSFLKISAPQAIPGFVGLRVRVPDEVLANTTAGLEPRLYALVADQNEFEDSGEFVRLDSAYDTATGLLSAPLSGNYFSTTTTSSGALDDTGAARPEAVSASATIVVSLADVASRRVPVTGTFTTPASGVVEARIRDTININGTFNIRIPISLQSPTAAGTVTSAYAADHHGIDYRARDGDAVRAAAAGTVVSVEDQQLPGHPRCNPNVARGGGITVRIRHEDGSVSGYAHLLTGSVTVARDQQVLAGQQIAQADHTGGTCPEGAGGAHLHFGYRVNDQLVDPTGLFTNNQQQLEQQWLNKLSFIVSVNGTPIESTRRQVNQKNFTYSAPLDLSSLANIQSGMTYPLVISVQTTDGGSMRVYNGRLKVLSTAMRVVLTWDKNDTDVDLHVIDSQGRESWYANLCGIPNGCLDHDDTDGFGPETFSLTQFQQGLTYRVFLHYYSDHGNGPTVANTRVFIDDQLVTDQTATLSNNQMLTIGTYPQAQHGPQILEGVLPDEAPVWIELRSTSDPNVWEYSIAGLPRLYIVRKE